VAVKPVVTPPKTTTSTKATSTSISKTTPATTTSPVLIVKKPTTSTSTVDVLALAKQQFQKIYLRSANVKNIKDNNAITIMTYGIKFVGVKRNLKSEAAAITTFKHIYSRLPKTASDWNIIAAIAYSGAKR
jgi:hypothetical protein